jgi:alkaline phosphatase D
MLMPHVKFLEGTSRGYLLTEVTRTRFQSEWYFVPTVEERSAEETHGGSFVCESGSSRLAPA